MPLIERLKNFNAHERFYVVKHCLGGFSMSANFRQELQQHFHLAVPDNAFATMDYLLDWIYASLQSYEQGDLGDVNVNTGEILAQIEDVDWLVAFSIGEIYHLIMLEAKATEAHSNKQMLGKAQRLRAIFGEDGHRFPNVQPHFGILSPTQPQRLRITEWPTWMRPNNSIVWLQLPVQEDLLKVARCDQAGQASVTGGHWRIIPR